MYVYGRTFIFVENFHVNNLSVVLEIFHVFNFCGTRVPTKIIKPRTFPDLRYSISSYFVNDNNAIVLENKVLPVQI